MRKRNWAKYNKHLVRQGSVSFCIDSKFFRSMQHGPKSKRLKRIDLPLQFSDPLIQMLAYAKD